MRIVIGLLASLAAVSPAFADLCIQNSRAVATAGAKLLTPRADVLAFCAPCGDKVATPFAIGSVKVAQTDLSDDTSFEVMVDDKSVDLAYLYLCTASSAGRACQDVGIAAKCTDDPDVPALLPATALPK